MTSDLLVLGTIHTLDPARPRGEALLARHGRVVEVGAAAACRAAAAPGARVLDLAGGSAVPGLADAHGHVLLNAWAWSRSGWATRATRRSASRALPSGR